MLFAILGAVVVFGYYVTFRRPVLTVIVVRHAEKVIDSMNPDVDLSPADRLAPRRSCSVRRRRINAIYATVQADQQTVQPLSDKLGVPVTIMNSRTPGT